MYRIQRFVALTLHVAMALLVSCSLSHLHTPTMVLPYAAFALCLNVVWYPRYEPLVDKTRKSWENYGKLPDAWGGWQQGI